MVYASRPFRSMLYIPGSKERALEKAADLACDAIIFDLEDAVAIDAKAEARELLKKHLSANDYGNRSLIVRVNGQDTDWHKADLEVICATGPEAILLPKVDKKEDVQALAAYLDQHPACADTVIWAMMETPLGVLNAVEIALSSPRFKGMVMGTNDLLKDTGGLQTADRTAMLTSLSSCLLAARAAGVVIVDGVYNAFKDDEGLRVEAEQGRVLGFDGKTLIHPAQLAVANDVFAPSEADIELAGRQIAAFEEAEAKGQGIAVLNGQIVENLHVVTAQKVLAKAAAIAINARD